jgi:hypothetical protein
MPHPGLRRPIVEDLALVERLRTWRGVPTRDLSLAGAFGAARQELKRRSRTLGAVATAWTATLPANLVERTALVGFSRGVLTVRCDDNAARFELDRFLRSGGELELIRRAPAGLARVRLLGG